MRNRLLSIIAVFVCLWACEKAPKEIAVSSVTLNQTSANLVVGGTIQLNATVNPSDATDKTITWASSNQGVASVAGGKVTAVAEGNATITATAGGKTASCSITVTKEVVEVTSVELNKNEIELTEGESETLIATVKPADATDKSVTWSSSVSEIASVENGKITAIKEGEATITAKAGEKTATCHVVVAKKVIPVESVELSKVTLELKEGESETLVATVKPDNATDKTVTWKSSDESIASVDAGKVTAIKEGTAAITAKAGEKESVCSLTVHHNPAYDPIVFADGKVKTKLVAAFDLNGDGELSYAEAAVVSSISGVFGDETTFTSFEEFQYFTGVTTIPDNQFKAWSILSSIVLPESITEIGYFAFEGCENLQAINIPSKVNTIKADAFLGCKRISSISLPSSISTIGASVFRECTNLQTVTLPDGITELSSSLFYDCKKLASITIPETVNKLGNTVFSGCESLTSIVLPNSVTKIGNSTFANCYSLKEITLSTSLDRIEEWAFIHCTGLEEITIPESVKSIGKQAFYGCKSLSYITLISQTPPYGQEEMFYTNSSDFSNLVSIFVPAVSVDIYKIADYWSEYADKIISTPGAVDLGLSIKWASFNVGATKPEDYGDYYAWGETWTKDNYNWENYKWYNYSSNTFNKYNYSSLYGTVDNKTVLEPHDDVSHVKLSGNWRMPTDAEWHELMEQCTWTWTTLNGVNGRLITSKTNGNSIFLPAAGYRSLSDLSYVNSSGFYWASSLYTETPNYAWGMYFNDANVYRTGYYRYYGFSVRPVTD